MKYLNSFSQRILRASAFLDSHKGEIISIILSFVVLSILINVKIAALLAIVLIIHEGGHGWAMLKKNMGINKVFFFIIGGGISPKRQFESYNEVAFVAIMGSVFTLALIVILSLVWCIFKIGLLANVIILLSTITVFNLLPYAFLDGGLIQNSIQKSDKFGQIYFLIPEIMIVSFLVFKSKIVLFILILLLIDSWKKYKGVKLEKHKLENNPNPEAMTSLTKKEIRTYYAAYFAIVIICIMIGLMLELNGFSLDMSFSLDNISKDM